MAKEMGAFEKHGVKADLIYISSGSVTVQAMVGGNLDMSVAASNAVVSSILRGAPLVAVGSITNRPARVYSFSLRSPNRSSFKEKSWALPGMAHRRIS